MHSWLVQSELKGSLACAETSLLHARRPSLWTPLGVIPVASPSLPHRAASDQGPGQHAVLTGSSPHGAPNGTNRPTTHVPQPLLHLVRRLRASLALYGWLCGVANGAGPWRCTAGVTPASTRTRDSRTEARTGPGPLYPRNGKRPHTIQRTCDDTACWPPTKTR